MSGHQRQTRIGGARGIGGGFTLAEILVCVVIIGIAAAVVVPQIGTRDDLRAAAAARVMMADLLYAQNRAIATQTRHYVVFTTSSPQCYRIVTQMTPLTNIAHPLTKASEYLVRLGAGGTSGLEGVTLGNVSFEDRTVLVFDELGVPHYYDPGSGSVTQLSVPDGSAIEVVCDKFKVTLSIQPYTGEITAR